mmetsp:Transcript_4113/g.12009  ORF Transcript_4113/g.12009 Transcript_4113/m.12009 type:complete len:263 (+) Transcript_4113:913-1701(+)
MRPTGCPRRGGAGKRSASGSRPGSTCPCSFGTCWASTGMMLPRARATAGSCAGGCSMRCRSFRRTAASPADSGAPPLRRCPEMAASACPRRRKPSCGSAGGTPAPASWSSGGCAGCRARRRHPPRRRRRRRAPTHSGTMGGRSCPCPPSSLCCSSRRRAARWRAACPSTSPRRRTRMATKKTTTPPRAKTLRRRSTSSSARSRPRASSTPAASPAPWASSSRRRCRCCGMWTRRHPWAARPCSAAFSQGVNVRTRRASHRCA